MAMASAALVTNAADIAAGKAKAGVCASCHGRDGISATPMFPSLAGQSADYLAKQLFAFKNGSRQDATMQAMVTPLSAEDIDNLAAYFSSLPAASSD